VSIDAADELHEAEFTSVSYVEKGSTYVDELEQLLLGIIMTFLSL
jgi:hypothetical protein